MKKIILEFERYETREEIQEYLADSFGFPDYYGMNLDALFDCLTDIHEYTCIGLFLPDASSPVYGYLMRMAAVFRDAEEENDHLGVIFISGSQPEDGTDEEL